MDEALTTGVKNALARGDFKAKCAECGFALPKYPGRYPKCCPNCDTPMEEARAKGPDDEERED